MMARIHVFATLAALGLMAHAAPALADEADTLMNQYFAIWSDNARITPRTVDSLYAPRAVYYGRSMTPDEVYRDKVRLIQRWPDRRYRVVPGTVAKRCDTGMTRCGVSVVLSWQAANPSRRAATSGRAVINLALANENGILKIVRESQTRVPRSAR